MDIWHQKCCPKALHMTPAQTGFHLVVCYINYSKGKKLFDIRKCVDSIRGFTITQPNP